MLDVNDFEMKQIVIAFFNNGDTLCFRNDNLVVKDKDGKIKYQSTCYRLFAIFIVGNTSLTTVLIEKSKKFGFSIVLFTSSFRIYEVIGFKRDSNILLHKKQYEYNSLDLAKHLTINKMNNQIGILKNVRCKDDSLHDAIDKISSYMDKIQSCNSLQDLMGYEGMASRLFFKSHFDNCNWNGRKPRIKCDYINSTLDIGYTILFAFVEALLNIYGFDVYYGVMHKLFYMRKSLVCDLIEPFRCLIDAQTKKSINLQQFNEEDFEVNNNRYELSWKKSSSYVSIFLKTILDNKKDMFLYFRQYYRCFMQQKNITDYPIFNFK